MTKFSGNRQKIESPYNKEQYQGKKKTAIARIDMSELAATILTSKCATIVLPYTAKKVLFPIFRSCNEKYSVTDKL